VEAALLTEHSQSPIRPQAAPPALAIIGGAAAPLHASDASAALAGYLLDARPDPGKDPSPAPPREPVHYEDWAAVSAAAQDRRLPGLHPGNAGGKSALAAHRSAAEGDRRVPISCKVIIMSEAGTYTLHTINGSPPPQLVKPNTVVCCSTIVLTPPHDFSGFFHYEVTNGNGVTTLAKEEWTVAGGGRYSRTTGLEYRFVNPNDSAFEGGTIDGDILILHAGGIRFQYERI
jgi:hypothetical protein